MCPSDVTGVARNPPSAKELVEQIRDSAYPAYTAHFNIDLALERLAEAEKHLREASEQAKRDPAGGHKTWRYIEAALAALVPPKEGTHGKT